MCDLRAFEENSNLTLTRYVPTGFLDLVDLILSHIDLKFSENVYKGCLRLCQIKRRCALPFLRYSQKNSVGCISINPPPFDGRGLSLLGVHLHMYIVHTYMENGPNIVFDNTYRIVRFSLFNTGLVFFLTSI